MKRKRIKEPKPVKVDGVEEWEVEKILNKWKIRKEVLSVMGGVYSKEWYMRKRERFGKCKRVSRWVQRKNKSKS